MTPAPRPTSGSPRSDAGTLLARTDAVARSTTQQVLRHYGMPPGIEREDVLVIARVAAWKAAERFDPQNGANWNTWVIGQTRHAIREIFRQRAYGGANRVSGRRLLTVPLHVAPGGRGAPFEDLLADPLDAFTAADARLLVRTLRVQLKPRLWGALEARYLRDLRLHDYAAEIGRTESRVHQLVAEGRRAARTVLEVG